MARISYSKGTFLPLVCMASAWGLAFHLSCHLTASAKQIASVSDEPTLAGALLGESRMAFSRHFEKTADLYFHRGAHQQHEQAFTNSLFQIIQSEISPVKHVHTTGVDVKETLPWFWLSIKMNPKNVESYLVSAFWLSTGVKRHDLAHQVLHTGRINNPLSYEIETEDGTIYLRERKYDEALKTFNCGLSLWPGTQDPDSEEAILGKTHLLFYIALLYEIMADIPNAVAHMKQIQLFYPDDEDLKKRIDELEIGNKPSHLAEQLLHATLNAKDGAVSCHRDDHHDHDHHDEGDHH